MWSKLTITAVVLMLVAGFFFYNNHESLQTDIRERETAARTLETTNRKIDEETALLEKAIATRQNLENECTKLEQQHGELVENNERVTSEIAQKTADLDAISKRLADIEERSKGMKNVAQLAAQIQRTEEDNNRLTEELAANTAKRDSLVERSAQLEKSIDALNKLEADQRARISPASLRTTVRNAFDDWGVVILSSGADQGVVLGSRLAVMRGNDKVAELLVNNVEGTKSSADVVPSSKAVGVQIMPGDVVVSVRPN